MNELLIYWIWSVPHGISKTVLQIQLGWEQKLSQEAF